MRKFVRNVLAVGVAVAGLAVPASATHSWGGYHWARTSNPFTLKLGDNVSSTWDPFLATTSTDWSQSAVLDTVIAPGGSRSVKLCGCGEQRSPATRHTGETKWHVR